MYQQVPSPTLGYPITVQRGLPVGQPLLLCNAEDGCWVGLLWPPCMVTVVIFMRGHHYRAHIHTSCYYMLVACWWHWDQAVIVVIVVIASSIIIVAAVGVIVVVKWQGMGGWGSEVAKPKSIM